MPVAERLIFTESAPNRWTVRLPKDPKIRGVIELHEFHTYKGKRRVRGSFWTARPGHDRGWRDAGVVRCETREQAIETLLQRNPAYQDNRAKHTTVRVLKP